MTGEHAFTILHYSGQHRENEIENVGGVGEGEGVRDRQSIRQKIILLPSIRTKMGKPLIHFRN
jgi:hypothetical protein